MSLYSMIFGLVLVICITMMTVTRRQKANSNHEASQALDALKEEIKALKERVVVLEKIQTDPGERLKREFETLD